MSIKTTKSRPGGYEGRKDKIMKRKVLKVNDSGFQYEVFRDYDATFNPYSVVKVWCDCGWHRKTIAKYAELKSVMYFLAETV